MGVCQRVTNGLKWRVVVFRFFTWWICWPSRDYRDYLYEPPAERKVWAGWAVAIGVGVLIAVTGFRLGCGRSFALLGAGFEGFGLALAARDLRHAFETAASGPLAWFAGSVEAWWRAKIFRQVGSGRLELDRDLHGQLSTGPWPPPPGLEETVARLTAQVANLATRIDAGEKNIADMREHAVDREKEQVAQVVAETPRLIAAQLLIGLGIAFATAAAFVPA